MIRFEIVAEAIVSRTDETTRSKRDDSRKRSKDGMNQHSVVETAALREGCAFGKVAEADPT